jgi:hypothetical protein
MVKHIRTVDSGDIKLVLRSFSGLSLNTEILSFNVPWKYPSVRHYVPEPFSQEMSRNERFFANCPEFPARSQRLNLPTLPLEVFQF